MADHHDRPTKGHRVRSDSVLILAARGGLLALVGSELVQVLSAPSPPRWSLLTAGTGAVIALAALTLLVVRADRTASGRFRSALKNVLPSARGSALLRKEVTALSSLWTWAQRGLVDVRDDEQPVKYHRGLRTTILVLVGVSILEIVLVHSLVPVPWLRVLLLLLGIYGSVLALAFLASLAVRLHVVRAHGFCFAQVQTTPSRRPGRRSSL